MNKENIPLLIVNDPKFESLLPLADKTYFWVTTENSRRIVGETANSYALEKIEKLCLKFMAEMTRLGLKPPESWRDCYANIIRPMQLIRERRNL